MHEIFVKYPQGGVRMKIFPASHVIYNPRWILYAVTTIGISCHSSTKMYHAQDTGFPINSPRVEMKFFFLLREFVDEIIVFSGFSRMFLVSPTSVAINDRSHVRSAIVTRQPIFP